jgi:hypothetical protein
MRLYVLLGGLVAVALAVVLIAGGGGDESSGAPANAKAAVATVQAFQKAIADRDYAKICEQLFTVEAREASGGGNCQSVLAQNASRIKSPRVRITGVVLRGNSASVAVVAQVAGGQPVGDTIRLVRSGKDGYRISNAGSPAGDS